MPASSESRDRVHALRIQLSREGLTGFIIPHSDEFQNEYLPACAERLAWLTGFSGSAGTAVVYKIVLRFLSMVGMYFRFAIKLIWMSLPHNTFQRYLSRNGCYLS